jgi:ribosome biogenesis SPOUT family RNA methylase Rps3|tara:strand:+ start:1562 stop:1777 length:216 start_codon:yes stop_codon:yes gene_type:complete
MAIIKATINKQAKVRARTVDVGVGIQLTDLSDVDTTNLDNGAMLIYDLAAQKFLLTNQIDNPDLRIIGGIY